MGGDHKCPVCQATFTRPQHVARHMRSHTGDRPYKCQYCGDQFARSDLLARHINKCHANEKPLANVAPGGRRKGSSAASRATTSKQACDQCVQSSLPCDGSNPCSKCASRKCRCTYIKFHRQTAPSGPGHHPPRLPSSSSSLSDTIASSRLPSNHYNGFVLAPPPSAPPLTPASFPGSDQIFNTPFTFNPAAPAYPPNWTTADMSQLPFSLESDVDMAAKYRAQAEFLRRAGPLSNGPTTILPNMYATQQNQPPSSNWYPTWGESGPYPSLDDTKSFDGIARTHSLTSSEPTSFAPEFYGASLIGSAYRHRKTSLDFSDSSSATSHSVPSSATSSSVHLLLPSSEMYDGSEEMQRQTHDAHILQHQRRSSMPSTSLPPSFTTAGSDPSQPPPSTQQPPRVGEGSFSSAFGLMSIDDPNVLAGLSSDGVPFFSHLGVGVLPHSPNATPMPTRVQHAHPVRERPMSLAALPTPGSSTSMTAKDGAGGDTKELRDMWKTYLRSPLGGSGTATLEGGSGGSTSAASLAQMPQSPTGQRRRVRVSSLPSVTPTVEKGHSWNAHANGHGHGHTHGHPEDLRSYEAAVNARSASLKFNLVPKSKRTRPSLRASPTVEEGEPVVGASSGSVPVSAGQGEHQGISRPSSSGSTSSLAQAFTVHPSANSNQSQTHGQPSHAHVVKPPPMQGASISLPIPPSMSITGIHSLCHNSHSHAHSVSYGSTPSLPFEPSPSSGSRASSVASDGTGTGGSGSDGEVFRPSFKRYASQTLGPASSKRALVERERGVAGGVKEVCDGGGGRGRGGRGGEMVEGDGLNRHGEGPGVGSAGTGAGSPGSRPIAALPERAKRG